MQIHNLHELISLYTFNYVCMCECIRWAKECGLQNLHTNMFVCDNTQMQTISWFVITQVNKGDYRVEGDQTS